MNRECPFVTPVLRKYFKMFMFVLGSLNETLEIRLAAVRKKS